MSVEPRRFWCARVLTVAVTLATRAALAHPLPDTAILLDVGREEVEAELRLPAAQFEVGFGRPVPRTSDALSAGLLRDIARYVSDHLSASHRDGPVWCTEVREVAIVIEPDASHSKAGVAHVYVKLVLVPPSGRTPRNFVLRTDLIVHELVTHRLFVYLRRDWKLRAASVEPFVLGRITYRTHEVAVDLFHGSE